MNTRYTDAVFVFASRREYVEAKDVLKDAVDMIASPRLDHWVDDADNSIWAPLGAGISVIKGLFDKENIKYIFRLGGKKAVT